jgi:hypothetical protein
MSSMTIMALLAPALAHARLNFFDIVAVVWLIIGLFWGRSRGVSQEWLSLLKWLGIVIAGGLLYPPLSCVIHQNTYYSVHWSNITAYLLIAIGVHVIYLRLRRIVADEFGGKKLFGRAEFFLGMMAGVARFACMLLAGLALVNPRVVAAAEPAKTPKQHGANLFGVDILEYVEFQQDMVFESLSGNWVQSNLKSVLIATATSGRTPHDGNLAHK